MTNDPTYSLAAIAATVRVSCQQSEGIDRHCGNDLEILETAGLMDCGICTDNSSQDSLEVGETMWSFNAAGKALIAALAGE